jgi:hypothetical protein
LARLFSLSFKNRANNPDTSPAGTEYFDIFSPFPGDNDVISQVERLSSNETKIALRSLRMVVGCADRAVVCIVTLEMRGFQVTSFSPRKSVAIQPMGSLKESDTP